MNTNFNWSATDFFKSLTEHNKFAKTKQFRFCRVSGIDGFEEALAAMQQTSAFVAVSDISQGYIEIANTPHTRRVKTVFLAMRHPIDDMVKRQQRMDDMRELFRQFMSKLILEKTRIEEHNLYLDTRITFNEIDRYFFSGCACAYFQIAVDTYTDLRVNDDEWTD